MIANAFGILSSAFQAASPVRPEFDAATVRPSHDSSRNGVRATTGLLTLENIPLRVLISVAYKTRPSLIAGGPSWIDSMNFDVQGKATGAAGADPMLLMLQTLLEERFGLALHREMREGAIYLLTVAKGGAKLKPSKCVPLDPNRLPTPAARGDVPVNYCGKMSRTGGGAERVLDGVGVSVTPKIGLLLPSLTGVLSDMLDRPVVDKTGLTGPFDIHLEWSPQRGTATQVTTTQADDTGGPSIFTALEEQLGLKLEAARGPIEFLVIDRAEKPSGN